jgi:hypothetical protein
MRGTIQRSSLCSLIASLIAAYLLVACASKLDVVYDEQTDFSRYHTWAWLPAKTPSVDAPHDDPDALAARLAGEIERRLQAQGFERGAGPVDFFVSYHLALDRQTVAVEVPRALYMLSSHHSSPSYWIERSETRNQVYQVLRLVIGIGDSGGRIAWRAVLEERTEDGAPPSVEEVEKMVATLLERFPPPTRVRGREPPPTREPSPSQLVALPRSA